MRDAFVQELTRLGAQDKRIVFLTADLGYKLFDGFAAQCPGRFLNMGVSEANMVSTAAGMALAGLRPVVYSIVPFVTARCLEQIRDDVCNMNLPVLMVGVGGGYAYGPNGSTHHGVDDVALMRALAGMTVLCPCDSPEVQQLLGQAFALNGPVYLRLGRNKEPTLTQQARPAVLGEPRVLREGQEVALVACGPIAGEALKAADQLAGQGLRPWVIGAHTVKPVAGLTAFLREARISHCFVIEEHMPCGGLGEALGAEMAACPERPLLTQITAPDQYLHEAGSQAYLWRLVGIDATGIVKTVTQKLGLKP